MRSLFCALVFLRLSMLGLSWIGRRPLITTLVVSAGLLAVAGAGFYWLEPRVPPLYYEFEFLVDSNWSGVRIPHPPLGFEPVL
jgi:hypothetical protein